MSKLLIGIIVAMGLSGMIYYQFSVVPMKNKIEEQTKVILAQDLRDQEQKATIEAIQNFGIVKGIWLGMKRILRCRPGCSCGIDPIPEIKG